MWTATCLALVALAERSIQRIDPWNPQVAAVRAAAERLHQRRTGHTTVPESGTLLRSTPEARPRYGETAGSKDGYLTEASRSDVAVRDKRTLTKTT